MKKSTRLLCSVLAVIMVLSSVTFTALAKGKPNSAPTLNESISKPDYAPEKVVTFMVTLKEECLIEAMDKPMAVLDYIATKEGKAALSDIEAYHKKMEEKIEKALPGATVTEDYFITVNALAVRAQYRYLSALERIEGVRSVSVSESYTYSAGSEALSLDENTEYSGDMMGSVDSALLGYSGEGSVVAVIDMTLDTDHEAFQTAPPGVSMTKEDVEAALASGLLNADGPCDEIYKSEKIPFAFDYSTGDCDVRDTQNVIFHGTHVSGSAVGNSPTFKGVAPDAQLVFLKIFTDEIVTTTEEALCSAIEDCALLGVDVVNISLGEDAGFTEGEIYDDVIRNCDRVGTHIVCAAGNADNQGANASILGLPGPLTSKPDSGIVGSPASYFESFAVGSVIRERDIRHNYILAGENKIFHSDANEGNPLEIIRYFEGRDVEYVAVPGYGRAEDYEGLSVEGKIVLVKRGEIPFVEKEQIAYSLGAVAIIFCNNDDSVIRVVGANMMPNVMITKSDSLLLYEMEEKTLSFSFDNYVMIPAEGGGLISVSSSSGVAPDMTLKPDIVAPGDGIYSTLPGGTYGEADGTSMACPQISGVVAIVKQYYRDYLDTLPLDEHNDFVNTVIMNNADLVIDPDGVVYTPRKQGSGLANITEAMAAESLLTVSSNRRPVAQLYSSTEGKFASEIKIHNLSDEEKTYSLSSIALMPKVEQAMGYDGVIYDCISLSSRELSSDEFVISFSEEAFTVPAGGEKTVSVSFTLTEKGKESASVFENGIYMEGYIIVTEGDDDMHIPYLGFYGDWAALDIFEETVYENPLSSTLYGSANCANGDDSFYMGYNELSSDLLLDENKIGFNHETVLSGLLPTYELGMLRSARSLKFEVFNENGERIELLDPDTLESVGYEVLREYVRKTFSANGDFQIAKQVWMPYEIKDGEASLLPDGRYTVRFSAMPFGSQDPSYIQTLEFPTTIDNELPEISDIRVVLEEGRYILRFDAKDNFYLKYALLADESASDALLPPTLIDESEKGATTAVEMDVTDLVASGVSLAKIMLADYAGNEILSESVDIQSPYIAPTEITLSEDSIECFGESTFTLKAYLDENASESTLVWESDNESIAKVISTETAIEDGTVCYKAIVQVSNKDGIANIRVKTENGLSATAEIKARALGDKSALASAVEKAEALSSEDFTAESFEKIEAALESAKAVLSDALAGQEAVDEALAALENAIETAEKAEKEEDKESEGEKPAPETGDSFFFLAIALCASACTVALVRQSRKRKE